VQKFAKLSIITQPGTARLRSNLVDFDHVTVDVQQTFKINGSKVKVPAWHYVLASKTL